MTKNYDTTIGEFILILNIHKEAEKLKIQAFIRQFILKYAWHEF